MRPRLFEGAPAPHAGLAGLTQPHAAKALPPLLVGRLGATHTLRLSHQLNMPAWEAITLNAVGWYRARLGDYDQAREHCEAALSGSSRHGDRHGEALATSSLAYIAHCTGDRAKAIDYYHRALTLLQDHANAYKRANILERAGHPLLALGHDSCARAAWRKAQELFQSQRRTADADRINQYLHDPNTSDD